MAATWLQVRVELVGGRDIECDPRPGRIFMVGPRHSFADLAEAIDVAFARWDRSHLHVFELSEGRRVGFADVDPEEHGWLDHNVLRVARELSPGERFGYTFDLGDDWRHVFCSRLENFLRCRSRSGGGAGCLTSTAARALTGRRSRPVEHALADDGAAQEHERDVQLGRALIARVQPAEVVQPCESALHDPPLAAQTASYAEPASCGAATAIVPARCSSASVVAGDAATTRFRPARLASYSAASAALNSVS
jgi:hypothetical protein